MLTAVGLVDEEQIAQIDDVVDELTVNASAVAEGAFVITAPDASEIRQMAQVAAEPGEPSGGVLISDSATGFVWSGYVRHATEVHNGSGRSWRLTGVGHSGLLGERLTLPGSFNPAAWPPGAEYSTSEVALDSAIVELANYVHGPSSTRPHPRHAGWSVDRDPTQSPPGVQALSGRLDAALDVITDRLPGSGLALLSVADGKGAISGRVRQGRDSMFEVDAENLGAEVKVTRRRPKGTAIYAGSKSGGSDDAFGYHRDTSRLKMEAFVAARTGTDGDAVDLTDVAAAELARLLAETTTIEVTDAAEAMIDAWGREFELGDYVSAVAAGYRLSVQFVEATMRWRRGSAAQVKSLAFGTPTVRSSAAARARSAERRVQALEGARWFL